MFHSVLSDLSVTPTHGMLPPTFRVALPSSVKLLGKYLHRDVSTGVFPG